MDYIRCFEVIFLKSARSFGQSVTFLLEFGSLTSLKILGFEPQSQDIGSIEVCALSLVMKG